MSTAYVDTSALLAVAFNQPEGQAIARRLDGFTDILASNLLSAELRSAFARERREFDAHLITGFLWVLPDRPLTAEIEITPEAGYLRGADLLHVATALYAAQATGQMGFVTLDRQQQAVAVALGFQT